MAKSKESKLPKLGLLYMDYVLRFFDKSNFKGWPDKIEIVTYHWKNDKARFIREVKRKKIDVLVGNIPATAYETFREIARELPNVRFMPSMDTQFSNKSKENVTRFAWKYDLPIPKTYIYYKKDNAKRFLQKCEYPKIVKKSYGPSNYGGYFVHKVDSSKEAISLFKEKKYYPQYFQDFVPMEADIRVMLIGHKPVCAFWRRAPEGEWLTNTSQGGSMDYMDVPKNVLDLAVKTSKAAKAEYWACDIAYGKDGKVRILECATAFAAFPYIRDWIGQYIMWNLSDGRFNMPHMPMFNWEELGKINPDLLRTMRNITFGKYNPSYDGAYFGNKKRVYGDAKKYIHELDEEYQVLNIQARDSEEWPSEKWNYQDNYKTTKLRDIPTTDIISDDESVDSPQAKTIELDKQEMIKILKSVKGIGNKKAKEILNQFSMVELVDIFETKSKKIRDEITWFNKDLSKKLNSEWKNFKSKI